MTGQATIFPPETIDAIKRAMARGDSLTRIAKDTGIAYHNVYRLVRKLEKRGVPMPKRKRKWNRVGKSVEAYIEAKKPGR